MNRRALATAGRLWIALGMLWLAQGSGLLPGRLVAGQPGYAALGACVLLVGCWLLTSSRRRGDAP